MKMSQNTRTHVKVLLVAWLAVTAAVLSTACSSSGGGTPPHKGPMAAKATPTPSPYHYTAPGVGGLDKNSSKSQQESASGSPTDTSNSNKTDADQDVVHYDPTGLTPTQVYSQPRTGNANGNPSDIQDGSGEPTRYSGASQDNLRAEILNIIAQNQEGDSAADAEFARELSKGMFSISGNLASVVVLQSLPNGDQYKLTLRGPMDGYGRIRFPAVGPGISGSAECLDLNGGCDNVHVKIVDASGETPRTAHMIIRSTNATLYTQGDGFGIAHNPEYDNFLNVLVNTATHKSDCGYVNKLVVQTSETLNGASTVAVAVDMLVGSSSQYLRFNGALIRDADSDQVNAGMVQTPANPYGGAGLISDTISNISLVRNDGHGNIQVAITIRAATAGSREDTMTLTLARIQKATKAATAL